MMFLPFHGVHRGKLKGRSSDDREKFIKNLIENVRTLTDIFGMNNIQPIWADQYFKDISNSKMGLNLVEHPINIIVAIELLKLLAMACYIN